MTVKKKATRRKEIERLVDPKQGKKFERDAENALIDFEEKVGRRYEFAEKVMEAQDTPTVEAIESLVEKMAQVAGRPVFHFRGVSIGDPDRLAQIQRRNHYWIAIRLLYATAEWDVQIANFQPLSGYCKCGEKV